jgi:hypothetical protein
VSDFLDILAAGGPPQDSVLEPLLPSRFERLPDPMRSDGGAQASRTSLWAGDPGDDAHLASRTAALQVSGVLSPDVETASRRSTSSAAPANDAAGPIQPVGVNVAPLAEAPEAADGHVPPAIGAIGTDLIASVVAISRQLRTLQAASSADVQPSAPSTGHVSSHDVQIVPQTAAASQASPSPIVAPPRPASEPPRIVPEQLPSQKRSPSDSPTVNVTIGRIEIRGPHQREAAPSRREPRARVMSLEQYLERRAAGGAR